MNIKTRLSTLFLFIIFCGIGKAQDNYQFGLLPVINVNKKLPANLKLNFKTESRQIIYKEQNFKSEHELIDFSAIASTKIGLNNSLAGGYLLRVRDERIVHRLIQQFAITQKWLFFRIAHRFSSDQTFEEEGTTFRFRYRISNQIPLNGQSINANEFYLKLNNEYLNSLQNSNYDLEIRLAVFLGYEFNDNNKLELGIENRLDSFIENQMRNRSWLNISWFIAI